jgi:hypothetical protein
MSGRTAQQVSLSNPLDRRKADGDLLSEFSELFKP